MKKGIVLSLSVGLFLTGESIGWSFEHFENCWSIRLGIIGMSFGWVKP